MVEALEAAMVPGETFRGVALATGSAGTIASGDYLKQVYPNAMIGAAEAIQCPTILYNGFGEHRIEGIGDKHIPWIHNVKNTDMVIGVDDEATISLTRLFNEPAGQGLPRRPGRQARSRRAALALRHLVHRQHAGDHQDGQVLRDGSGDVLVTVGTDSMEMYGSRLVELREERGEFTALDAAGAFHRYMLGAGIDHVQELGY